MTGVQTCALPISWREAFGDDEHAVLLIKARFGRDTVTLRDDMRRIIGQTKNIFAYRMICNDTVEDKILKLQERKKSLAKELISDEVGFVKSLTKDDIAYLFS